MTLQASGQISLSDIQTEFGGSNPIQISEYYGAATGIPASGEIQFSDFYGTSSYTINLPGGNDSDFDTIGNTATAGFNFYSNGTYDEFQGGAGPDWITPSGSGVGSDYEIRCTKNSGTDPSGSSLNSWLALSSTRQWYLQRTSFGTTTCNLTIQIRDSLTQTVQDSGTYIITVEIGS